MARYAFQCPACGLEFEVSRPMSEAGLEARCPADGGVATRIFEMPGTVFNRPSPGPGPAPARPPRGYSHHGHYHGPGTGAHSHQPPRP